MYLQFLLIIIHCPITIRYSHVTRPKAVTGSQQRITRILRSPEHYYAY